MDAGAAVFVIGLEDEIFAIFADIFEEAEGFTVARGLRVGQEARPGNVAADEFALGRAEERGVLLVGEDSEECFFVRNFAGERVGDADCAGFVGFDERGTFAGTRDDIVDQDAAIDEVHALAVGGEFAGF